MRTRTIATGLTVAMLAAFEGYRQIDYRDPVGVPTACFGSTASAIVGTRRTIEGCEDLLFDDVRAYQQQVLRNTEVDINDNQLAALTSFVYNVGEGAYRSSTLLKKLNAGKYDEACRELPRWVYGTMPGTGIKVQLGGLVKRRQREMEICLSDPLFQ